MFQGYIYFSLYQSPFMSKTPCACMFEKEKILIKTLFSLSKFHAVYDDTLNIFMMPCDELYVTYKSSNNNKLLMRTFFHFFYVFFAS